VLETNLTRRRVLPAGETVHLFPGLFPPICGIFVSIL